MYQRFRERLLQPCCRLYEDWPPLDILSLMQHSGGPTRLLDFSFSPIVAAHFALEKQQGESKIWVVSLDALSRMAEEYRLPPYMGPAHVGPTGRGRYEIATKFYEANDANVAKFARIVTPRQNHGRIAAQDGCFLNPSSISKRISLELVDDCIILSKSLVDDSLRWLREEKGCSQKTLFPELEEIADEAGQSSVKTKLTPQQHEQAVAIKNRIDACAKERRQILGSIDALQEDLNKILDLTSGA